MCSSRKYHHRCPVKRVLRLCLWFKTNEVFTCVVCAVDNRSHWETQRDAELRSRGTTTSLKQKNHSLLIFYHKITTRNEIKSNNKISMDSSQVYIGFYGAHDCTWIYTQFNAIKTDFYEFHEPLLDILLCQFLRGNQKSVKLATKP